MGSAKPQGPPDARMKKILTEAVTVGQRGNWIQTDPKKGWFTILRLYSPLEPLFTKAWRPSEIELVR